MFKWQGITAAVAEGERRTKAAKLSLDSNEDTDRGNSEVFDRLHTLASTAHQSLTAYGSAIEMGRLPYIATEENSAARNDVLLNDEKREKLRGMGRSLWMAVRSNPDTFRDNAPRDNTHGIENKNCHQQYHQKAGLDPKSNRLEATGSDRVEQKHRAAASGYVRAIAARLVLIEHIRTKNKITPELILFPSEIDAASDKDKMLNPNTEPGESSPSKASPPTSSPRPNLSPVPKASCNELEFGLKSFARAGRAVLMHGADSNAAYSMLSLAVGCWEGMVAKAEHESIATASTKVSSKNTSPLTEAAESARRNLDEAFDGLALLPDAASLVSTHPNASLPFIQLKIDHQNMKQSDDTSSPSPQKKKHASSDNEAANHTQRVGSPCHVLAQLKRLEDFVARICLCREAKDTNGTANEFDSYTIQDAAAANLAVVQRYLPCLARVSYKVSFLPTLFLVMPSFKQFDSVEKYSIIFTHESFLNCLLCDL